MGGLSGACWLHCFAGQSRHHQSLAYRVSVRASCGGVPAARWTACSRLVSATHEHTAYRAEATGRESARLEFHGEGGDGGVAERVEARGAVRSFCP